MADISKKLKLIAELDDRKIKRQIADLKKDLEGLKLNNQDLSGLTKSANIFKSAAEELRKAVKELRGISPARINAATGTSAGTRGAAPGGGRSPGGREIFDPTRGRYAKITQNRPIYDQEFGKRFKNEQDLEAFKRKELEKTVAKESQLKKRADDKAVKNKEMLERQAERRREQRAKGRTVAAGRLAGVDLPVMRELVESVGGDLPGGFRSLGSRAGRYRAARKMGAGRGLARGLASRGALMGLGAVGAMAGAGTALGSGLESYRQIRSMRAQREQVLGLGAMQGDFLGSSIEKGGREDTLTRLGGGAKGAVKGGLGGLLAGAAAGGAVGAAFGGIGAIPGAIIGGGIGLFGGGALGAITGAETAGAEEGEVRRQETARALGSLKSARRLRGARNNALRGGGVESGDLTMLQGAGAQFGFGADETMQQFTQARQFLGNRGAMQNLPAMQHMMNQTGTSIAEQAQAGEIFTGAQKGGKTVGAAGQVFQVLKKGVAAGLDASKSGQFLKTTAEFVSSAQGLGQISVGDSANKLANLTAGFAGGGEATQTHLRQAQQLALMQKRESTEESGVAGLGNLIATQTALGENADPGQFLAGLNLSSTATVEDTMEALGVDEATAKTLLKGKQNVQGTGLEALGLEGTTTGRYIAAKETGLTTEGQLGREKALRGEAVGEGALPPSAAGSPEMQSLVADAKIQHQDFIQGMSVMNGETTKISGSFKQLRLELEKSIKALEKYTGLSVKRKQQ